MCIVDFSGGISAPNRAGISTAASGISLTKSARQYHWSPAAEDGGDLVRGEEEGRDDAEVAAAAPDRRVEIRVLVGARAPGLAVCEHELRLEQVVDRQPALAGQMADAPAECEAADARGRDDPARRRKAMLARRAVALAPGAAAADPDRRGPWGGLG